MSDSASNPGPAGTLPRLDVVVLNWNGRDVLEDCLGSLQASGYPDLRILMVDNASTDDSVAWCRARFPDVDIVVADRNLRWAGGNNLGLAHLRDRGIAGHVLILNNDTIIPAGSLDTLMAAFLDRPEAWAATPRICFASRPDRIWYDGGRVGRFTGWVRHAGIRRPAAGRSRAPRFVDYGTGCALLLDRRALDAVPGFDTGYRLYGEDTDYCLRLRAAGGRILHVPAATLLHKVSMSVGAGSPAKAYMKGRSHQRLLRTHWPVPRWPVLLPSQLLFLAAQAGWHIGRGRPGAALASVRGACDEILKRPHRY